VAAELLVLQFCGPPGRALRVRAKCIPFPKRFFPLESESNRHLQRGGSIFSPEEFRVLRLIRLWGRLPGLLTCRGADCREELLRRDTIQAPGREPISD